MFDTLGTTNWLNVGQRSAQWSNTGTSRTADGQHSRPGSDSGPWPDACGAGGGDGVPGITQASVMRCSSASVDLLGASATGSHKVTGKEPRRSGFASELSPIRSSFQVRFPHMDTQRTQLADVCGRNQQLRGGKSSL